MRFAFEKIVLSEDSSRLSRAIFATLCLIPIIATLLYGGVDTGTWALLIPLIGLAAILWIVDGLVGGGFLFERSSLLLPLVAVCLIGMLQLSFGLSLDPYSTRLFLIRLVCYTVFFAAALTFVNTSRRLNKAVVGIIVLGAIMALFGILQRIGNAEAIYGMRDPGQAILFGSFVNQHHFAAFMEMAGLLSLSLLIGNALTREKKFLVAICLLFNVVAVVLTSSRGGMIAFVAGAAFVVILSYLIRKRGGTSSPERRFGKAAWAAVGVAGLFLFVGFIVFLGGDESLLRITGMSGYGDDFTNGRLYFWSIALKIFFENPILGTGLDSFGVAFTRHDTWDGTFRVEQAHNDYLQTLSDAGIIGLAVIATFIFLLFKKALRVIEREKDEFRLRSAIGALAGCFAILIHSFFDFPLRTPSNVFFFLLLVVIATARSSVSSTDKG